MILARNVVLLPFSLHIFSDRKTKLPTKILLFLFIVFAVMTAYNIYFVVKKNKERDLEMS